MAELWQMTEKRDKWARADTGDKCEKDDKYDRYDVCDKQVGKWAAWALRPSTFPSLARLANPHPIASHDEELVQVRRVVGEHVLQPRNLGGQLSVRTEAKENHAGVSVMLSNDEFAKVAIIGEQNSVLVTNKR
jgi:hypothetical protein